MKKITFQILLSVVFLAVGCKKDWLDVNTTPNDARDATPQAVLSTALAGTGNLVVNTYQTYGAWTVGYWAKTNVVSGYNTYRTYNYTSATEQGIWNQSFNNLMDYDFVEKKALELKNHEYYIAMAKIMKAYIFQQVVDQYGNIPYAQALQGKANLTPTYDDAKVIYEDLIKQLDEARKLLIETDPDNSIHVGEEDIMFDGDLMKWRQFANSVKLRILMRQSSAPDRKAYIMPLLTALSADADGFLTEDAAVNPGYLKTSGKQNPFWDRYFLDAADGEATEHKYVGPTKYGISKVDHERGVAIFGSTSPAGIDLGDLNPPNHTPFGQATIFKSHDQDAILFQLSEVKFLQAEAVEVLGVNFGDARTLYEEGVAESFYFMMLSSEITAEWFADSYGVDPTRANVETELVVPYLESEEVDIDWDDSPNKLRAIHTQKWISMYLINSLEAWNEFRRTGFPVIPVSQEAVRPGVLPSRLLYPQTEEAYNSANVSKQGKIDQFTSKIFWDVN